MLEACHLVFLRFLDLLSLSQPFLLCGCSLVEHIVQEGAPDACQATFWLPLCLLAYFSVFVVQVQPVPLTMHLCVPSHFVKFNLLLVIAAIDEGIELVLTIEASPPHATLGAAALKLLPCFPALSSRYFVCVHL